MSDRLYDDFGHRQWLSIEAVSVVGTQSAIATLVATKQRVPYAAKITAISLVQTTGGTGAQSLVARKSLGGTGTLTAFGSYTLGTNADLAGGAFTLVETDFAAGDHFDIAIAEGTAARTDVINFSIAFEELPN